jgi:hypothetical protein
MKRIATILIILAVFTAAFAQDSDLKDLGDKVLGGSSSSSSSSTSEKINQPVAIAGRPIDIEIGHNQWQPGGISDIVLAAIVADMIEQAGGEIAANTSRILREGFERDQLVASKWVDTSSKRFDERTLKPAEIRFEVINGGEANSNSTSIGLGNDSLRLESGKSTAFITIVVRDLVTGKQLATITVRGSRSSTNLEGFSIASRFSWRGHGFPGFTYENWQHQSPDWRRAMIAVTAALDDLEKKIGVYMKTGQAPKESWRGRLEK